MSYLFSIRILVNWLLQQANISSDSVFVSKPSIINITDIPASPIHISIST